MNQKQQFKWGKAWQQKESDVNLEHPPFSLYKLWTKKQGPISGLGKKPLEESVDFLGNSSNRSSFLVMSNLYDRRKVRYQESTLQTLQTTSRSIKKHDGDASKGSDLKQLPAGWNAASVKFSKSSGQSRTSRRGVWSVMTRLLGGPKSKRAYVPDVSDRGDFTRSILVSSLGFPTPGIVSSSLILLHKKTCQIVVTAKSNLYVLASQSQNVEMT